MPVFQNTNKTHNGKDIKTIRVVDIYIVKNDWVSKRERERERERTIKKGHYIRDTDQETSPKFYNMTQNVNSCIKRSTNWIRLKAFSFFYA